MAYSTVSARLLFVILGDDLDWAHYVAVHLREIFRRDPQFPMDAASNGFDLVLSKKCVPDRKASYITGAAVRDVPIFCDLPRILLIEHRVKDGLAGQPGRKLAIIVGCDEREFPGAHGAVEDGCLEIHAL